MHLQISLVSVPRAAYRLAISDFGLAIASPQPSGDAPRQSQIENCQSEIECAANGVPIGDFRFWILDCFAQSSSDAPANRKSRDGSFFA